MRRSGQLKRTPMPRRTKALNPGAGLKRGGPLRRENPLVRVTPLASTGMTRKRPRDTGPSKDVKDLLRKGRAKGRCERCGGDGRLDVHHRRARKAGGTKRPEINSPENLLVLCRFCHHSITDTQGNRAIYEFEGLLIREDLRDPVDVPVKLADGWFLLDNAGGKAPATPPKKAAA